jgi:hypothetical protein
MHPIVVHDRLRNPVEKLPEASHLLAQVSRAERTAFRFQGPNEGKQAAHIGQASGTLRLPDLEAYLI